MRRLLPYLCDHCDTQISSQPVHSDMSNDVKRLIPGNDKTFTIPL